MLPLPSLPRLFTASARLLPWGSRWCVVLNGKRLVGHDGEGLTHEEAELLLEKVELEAQGLVARVN